MKRWKKEPAQENNNKDRAEFEAFDALKSSKKHEGEGTSQQHQQQPQQPEQPQQSRAAPSPAKRTSTPRTQKASSKLASVEAESTTLARASAAVALHANVSQRRLLEREALLTPRRTARAANEGGARRRTS